MDDDPSDQAPPETWPDLLAAKRAESSQDLEYLIEQDLPSLAESGSAGWTAEDFSGVGELLAKTTIVLGAASCRPAVAAFVPYLPRAIADLDRPLDSEGDFLAIEVLSFVNTARCCGVSLPPEADLIEQRWPRSVASRVGDLDEFEQQSAAFAALAAGETALVPVFIGGPALPSSLDPGQVFRANLQGFVRYVATAIEQEAEPAVVEPAWRSFLDYFPFRLAADTVSWSDLTWAARAVIGLIGGQSTGTIAEALVQAVRRADDGA